MFQNSSFLFVVLVLTASLAVTHRHGRKTLRRQQYKRRLHRMTSYRELSASLSPDALQFESEL